MGKTHKKEYTGSKAFDKTCRCNGSCPHCKGNRQYSTNKKVTLKQEVNLADDEQDY